MISSSSAIALAPAHPETAEHQPAAVDHCHPQIEPVAGEEIADQRERGDAEADRDKGVAHPQAGDGIDEHEIDRPERPQLARREMSQPAAKYSESNEQRERREHAQIEGANSLTGVIISADDERSRDPHRIDRDPD